MSLRYSLLFSFDCFLYVKQMFPKLNYVKKKRHTQRNCFHPSFPLCSPIYFYIQLILYIFVYNIYMYIICVSHVYICVYINIHTCTNIAKKYMYICTSFLSQDIGYFKYYALSCFFSLNISWSSQHSFSIASQCLIVWMDQNLFHQSLVDGHWMISNLTYCHNDYPDTYIISHFIRHIFRLISHNPDCLGKRHL